MECTVIMRRTEAGLEPVDRDAAAILGKVKMGDRVLVKVHRPRSIQQHRMLFALLTKVAEATEFETPDALLTALKVALGRYDLLRLPSGKVVPVPQSISFAAMKQDEFQRFLDDCVRVICRDLLPGIASADLVEEIMQMIGGVVSPEPPGRADDPLVTEGVVPF